MCWKIRNTFNYNQRTEESQYNRSSRNVAVLETGILPALLTLHDDPTSGPRTQSSLTTCYSTENSLCETSSKYTGARTVTSRLCVCVYVRAGRRRRVWKGVTFGVRLLCLSISGSETEQNGLCSSSCFKDTNTGFPNRIGPNSQITRINNC